MRPRLIIADDHRLVAQSLGSQLGRRYTVVGVVFTGDELLALLRDTLADCLLLDLAMPGKSGLELLPHILRIRPALKVIIVTMHLDRALAESALRAGASGFVPKDAGLDELDAAIAEALKGHSYLSPRVPKSSHRVSLGARHSAFHRLTPRQQEIVFLMGEGKKARDICLELSLSPSTITFHKKNIMRTLGIETESGLVRYAVLARASSKSRSWRG